MLDEKELIKGCAKNDRTLQKKLYELYCKRMLAVALRYSKNRLEAEDILQESFIKVFNNIKNFRKECPLEQWIKRIVINTALKQNRSKLYLYPAIDIQGMEESIADEEFTLSSFSLQELLGMIQSLAPRYQIVFNLYAIEGYQHNEIAEMLGIQEGTSKSQYARARAQLQNMIRQSKETGYEESKQTKF
jgi:RNA polymerase sigma factor (sigma-70 family)